MITTITPLRRVAVTLVLTGATAFGAVSIAPAAFADEATTVTEQAPVIQDTPAVVAAQAPVVETPAPVVEAPAPVVQTPAPVVEAPAPVVEQAPAPAPVVTPPVVVIGKDGKPVKAPKTCTDKDQKEYAEKLAKANQQAAPLLKNASQLRAAANALHAQAVKLTGAQAWIVEGLAKLGDLAASKLEAQAQAIITKVGGIGCIVVETVGGRF
jgi:outer membrane biosynthesis protein TonB